MVFEKEKKKGGGCRLFISTVSMAVRGSFSPAGVSMMKRLMRVAEAQARFVGLLERGGGKEQEWWRGGGGGGR